MQKHLPGDLRDDADAQHRAVQVGRAQGDHNAHDQQHRKRTDEDNTAEEAQLLTDDAEDKVVFGVGQPLVLLHARADAHAEHAACGDGIDALTGLPPHTGSIQRRKAPGSVHTARGVAFPAGQPLQEVHDGYCTHRNERQQPAAG